MRSFKRPSPKSDTTTFRVFSASQHPMTQVLRCWQGVRQIAACLRAEARLPDSALGRNTWFCLVHCLVGAPLHAAAGNQTPCVPVRVPPSRVCMPLCLGNRVTIRMLIQGVLVMTTEHLFE